MRKGQYYPTFKLLQAAVFTAVFLMLVLVALDWLDDFFPGNVAGEAGGVLNSAYNARGTRHSFVNRARLTNQYFTGEGVRYLAGLPADVDVKIVCEKGFCTPLCPEFAGGCEAISLEEGAMIDVCAACKEGVPIQCRIYLGESDCLW